MGEFTHTAGEFNGDATDKGIKMSEDARHYAISAKLDFPFTNRDKVIIIIVNRVLTPL
jgi:calreticulin